MSYHHFFLEHQVLADAIGDVIELDLAPDDMKHASVLRLNVGETIAVIDAASDYFICEITDISKSGISVRIASKEHGGAQRPSITLFQGLSKGERFEEVLRHSVELGIDCFVPLVCERCVVRLDEAKAGQKVKRWQAIAKSAAMQSGRRTIPGVTAPMPLGQLREIASDFTALFFFYEECDGSRCIRDIIDDVHEDSEPDRGRYGIIIGPEGGFSYDEVRSLASIPNVYMVSLGDTILRTETAGVVATALVSYELGGLGNSRCDG